MANEKKISTVPIIIGVIIGALSLAMVVLIYFSLPQKPNKEIVTVSKKMAGELADNNLPQAAIEEYQRILDRADLTDSERGAIYYLMAKTYFEDVGDYEKAAADYIRARSLDPNASYITEAGKNLITCLEKMGRRLDARRELDQQASAHPDTTQTPGKLVARVGSQTITVADFNQAIQSLPPDMQKQMSTRDQRRKFLDQMIGRDLIYHAALREGMDRDEQVQKDMKEVEKEYLVQYYTQTKIAPTVKPDSSDLMLYFQANKDKYDGKEFDKVRDQVTNDYMNYIGQKAVKDYISTLLQAEPVQIYEENVK